MNITGILENETPNRRLKHLVALKWLKWILAISVESFVVLCAAPNMHAQTVYSVNIVGCVPDMTIYLLTAPVTTAQRQALHAQNFNQLAPSVRPIYLHTVAYGVGLMVTGQVPTSTMLANHLIGIDLDSTFIYQPPAIPPEYSQAATAHLQAVNIVMQYLNAGIVGQIANNPNCQQAMYAGAVSSFWWATDDGGR